MGPSTATRPQHAPIFSITPRFETRLAAAKALKQVLFHQSEVVIAAMGARVVDIGEILLVTKVYGLYMPHGRPERHAAHACYRASTNEGRELAMQGDLDRKRACGRPPAHTIPKELEKAGD